jgi:peptidoglycan/LPS O-acetylase OafA/YrhL
MRAVRLSEVAACRENNFDVLRLVAAGIVLAGHSWPLGSGRRQPFAHVHHPLGTVGVEIFFVISGFLVTRSWLAEPSLRRFAKKRALRILPGLAGAVLVTALVIGPIFSTASLGAYYSSTSVWGWIVSNILLVPQWVIATVFVGNPYGQAANGSLWTLPIEVEAYVLLALLGVARLVRRGFMLALAIAAGVALAIGSGSPMTRLFGLFVAGSVLYLLRDRVVLRSDVAIVLATVWLAAFATPLATTAGMVALPYLVAFAAYRSPSGLRRLVGKGDVSYGFYVYAFPIQQSIAAVLGPTSPFVMMAIAAPLTWLAAFASWRLIEQPMLRLKRPRQEENSRGELRVAAGTVA